MRPNCQRGANDAAVCPLGNVFHCTLARFSTARFTCLTEERPERASSSARGARVGIQGKSP